MFEQLDGYIVVERNKENAPMRFVAYFYLLTDAQFFSTKAFTFDEEELYIYDLTGSLIKAW